MSLLSKVITNKRRKPLAMVVYAGKGLGKTNLAIEAPKPIYVGSEENDEIDAARLPKVEAWAELESQLKALRDEKHDFKTLVLDTVDALEQVAQKEILSGPNVNKTMATAYGGYGKAYEKMADMFLEIRDRYLVPLRDVKGMNIVILAHAEKNKHEDPMTNTSYDCFSTAMHKKVKPIFEDWVSAILFINYDLIRTDRTDGKTVLEGLDGKRVIYTEERPSHVAKNRFNLPYEIDYNKTGTWAQIEKHIDTYFGKAAQEKGRTEEQQEAVSEFIEIQKQIDKLMPSMPEEVKGGIATSVSRAVKKQDINELKRIFNKMKSL